MIVTEQQRVTWPRRWVLAVTAIGFVLVAGVTTAVVLWLAGDDEHTVDENSWREASEELLGPIEDWALYRDTWLAHCERDDLEVVFRIALTDQGTAAEEVRTNFTFACPARLAEFDAYLE